MTKALLFSVLIVSTTTVCLGNSDQSRYVDYVLSLDFEKADSLASILDSGGQTPLFLLLTTIYQNAGQEALADLQQINSLSDDEPISYLIQGAYALYNNPNKESAFVLLNKCITKLSNDQNKDLLKLCYFSILELYSREAVLERDGYLYHLAKFEDLVSDEVEEFWLLLHHVETVTKLSYVDTIAYRKSFEHLQQHYLTIEGNNRPLASHYYFQEGVFYRTFGEDAKAREAYEKAIISAVDEPFLRYIKFSSYIHLVSIESQSKQYARARQYLNLANDYQDLSDSLKSQFILSRWSSYFYYRNVGQFDSAYHNLERSIYLETVLNTRNNALKIAEQNIKLQTEEKEKEIINQQSLLATQNRWLWTVAIFSFVLLILSITLILAFRNIRQKNLQIETLMRELHHRVKNNLQVISSLLGLQSMKLEDETARKAVSEGKGRIRAMSLIHQKLYQNEKVTSLNVKEYITNLVNELAQSYGYRDQMEINLDVPEISLDADTSLPIGLIVNELVSNAFKYAYHDVDQPMLELSLIQENHKDFRLLIKDNGPGLPEGFIMERTTSFGMKLVNLLIKQLKGSISLESKNGLSYNIKFQLN